MPWMYSCLTLFNCEPTSVPQDIIRARTVVLARRGRLLAGTGSERADEIHLDRQTLGSEVPGHHDFARLWRPRRQAVRTRSSLNYSPTQRLLRFNSLTGVVDLTLTAAHAASNGDAAAAPASSVHRRRLLRFAGRTDRERMRTARLPRVKGVHSASKDECEDGRD